MQQLPHFCCLDSDWAVNDALKRFKRALQDSKGSVSAPFFTNKIVIKKNIWKKYENLKI